MNEAAAPALLSASAASRVLVFAFACKGSGVPPAWLAGLDKPGVNLLPDLSPATARFVAGRIAAAKQIGDLVVASIHWGGNWGYVIPSTQRIFAHALVDAGVDIVHGHSSHHPRSCGRRMVRWRALTWFHSRSATSD